MKHRVTKERSIGEQGVIRSIKLTNPPLAFTCIVGRMQVMDTGVRGIDSDWRLMPIHRRFAGWASVTNRLSASMQCKAVQEMCYARSMYDWMRFAMKDVGLTGWCLLRR